MINTKQPLKRITHITLSVTRILIEMDMTNMKIKSSINDQMQILKPKVPKLNNSKF